MLEQAVISGSEPYRNVRDTTASRKAVVSGSVGSALEWFDFSIYGAVSATVFPALFFSEMTPGTALLASFATFGAGFFARPLGGLVFGALGDRLGRKRVLTWTLLLMGFASALIGILPGYGQIGILAPFLLVMLRFLQGVGLGGEATGSQLLAMEHAPDDRRGLYGALMAIGSPISQVLASLTLAGLAAGLSKEDFNEWGWRIPFLASFLLIGVGFYIRRSVEETPVFVNNQKVAADKPRALAVLQAHPKTLALLVMSWGASAAIFYICVTFAIYYLTGPLGLDRSISFSLLIVANGVSIFGGLLGGHLSDRIGRKKVLSIGLFLLLVATVLLFPVLGLKNWFASAAIISLALFAIQMNAGAQPAFFAESFPTNFRFTGSALGYTCSTMIFAAPAPFIATYLLGAFGGDPIGIVFYGLAIIVISAFALWRLPDRRGIPFE